MPHKAQGCGRVEFDFPRYGTGVQWGLRQGIHHVFLMDSGLRCPNPEGGIYSPARRLPVVLLQRLPGFPSDSLRGLDYRAFLRSFSASSTLISPLSSISRISFLSGDSPPPPMGSSRLRVLRMDSSLLRAVGLDIPKYRAVSDRFPLERRKMRRNFSCSWLSRENSFWGNNPDISVPHREHLYTFTWSFSPHTGHLLIIRGNFNGSALYLGHE